LNLRHAASSSTAGAGTVIAIVAFVALLIGAIWIFALEIVHRDREETISTAIDRKDNLVIALEEFTIRTIDSADAVLKYMIREYVRSSGKVDLDKFAADHAIDNSAFSGIVVADEKGNVVTTAYLGRPDKPVNVADREHFQIHIAQRTNNVFVGKPVRGRISGNVVIPITRRISKPDNSFGGVAMVLIEHQRFTDVLQAAKMRQFDVISLIGFDGITRARLRGATPTAGEDISKSPLFAELARNAVGHYAAHGQVDGVKRIFSYRSLPEYQLIATVGAAEANVLARYHSRRWQYFWTAGVASVWIAGFAFLLILLLEKQRRAAASVARSQARFMATFNQAAVGITHTDIDGHFTEVNQRFCDITGYTRDELLGRRFIVITHPDDTAFNLAIRRQMTASASTNLSPQFEKRYIRKDGTVVWCLLSLSVVLDDVGNIDYQVAISQDISQRRAAETALKNLEQKQRLLAEQAEAAYARLAEAQAVAKIGSWETTFPDFKVAWSEETYRIFETDPSCFQSTHPGFMAFIHPEDRSKVDVAFSSSLADQLPHTIEHRIVMPDGRIKIVEERWRVFFDDQGQAVRAVGTCQDITDKKQAEQERAQLAAIVESSNDAIISRDLNRVILSWNRAAERMFGWTAAEVLGQSVRIIIPPESTNKLEPLTQRLINGEAVSPVEVWRMRKDGTRIETQISFSALRDRGGNIIAISTIIRDITERKLAEAALRDYAAQMRHLSWRLSEVEEKERGDIHRELHDQIGANLSALKLDLNLIVTMLAANASPAICERLQKAMQLTGEIIVRIRDVMADLRPPALDDYGLLAALRSHAQSQATHLGIPITVEGEEIQPRPPIAVETALFRIVQEALSNIAKHAQAHFVSITVHATADRVTLVVADDGVGFDAARPAPRLDNWGLRTMRERAQAIAAHFRVESSPGNGTRVIVELSREIA